MRSQVNLRQQPQRHVQVVAEGCASLGQHGLVGAAQGLELRGLGAITLGTEIGDEFQRTRGEHDDRDGDHRCDRPVAPDPQAQQLARLIAVGADEATGEEATQILGQRVSAGIAVIWPRRHGLLGDGDEVGRQLGNERAQGLDLIAA